MIKVAAYRNNIGYYKGFKLLGHADFANRGKDIICSAVSVLVITTVNAIERFTDDQYEMEDDEDKGYMLVRFKTCGDETKLLMDSMLLGFEGIQKEYGKRYISIKYIDK